MRNICFVFIIFLSLGYHSKIENKHQSFDRMVISGTVLATQDAKSTVQDLGYGIYRLTTTFESNYPVYQKRNEDFLVIDFLEQTKSDPLMIAFDTDKNIIEHDSPLVLVMGWEDYEKDRTVVENWIKFFSPTFKIALSSF